MRAAGKRGNSGDGDPTTNEMRAFPTRWPQTISVAAVKKSAGVRIHVCHLLFTSFVYLNIMYPLFFPVESNPGVDFAGIGIDSDINETGWWPPINAKGPAWQRHT